MLLHTLDVSKSFDRILIKTVDSDIVIITIAAFRKSPSIKELWIELGRGLYSSSGDCIAYRATDFNWTDFVIVLLVDVTLLRLFQAKGR